ncbi:MAG: hypothetical protein PHC88_12610 [Terrimicrobiaceae bacterium]|nr:hypothetical protein [Terrimicrobiaceae bacterium]
MKMKHIITGAALAAAIVQTTLAARLPEFLPRDQVASVLAREDAARNAAQPKSAHQTRQRSTPERSVTPTRAAICSSIGTTISK